MGSLHYVRVVYALFYCARYLEIIMNKNYEEAMALLVYDSDRKACLTIRQYLQKQSVPFPSKENKVYQLAESLVKHGYVTGEIDYLLYHEQSNTYTRTTAEESFELPNVLVIVRDVAFQQFEEVITELLRRI